MDAKKQTAVEWLMDQVHSDEYTKAFGQTYISIVLVDQALTMEKEQIIDSFVECWKENMPEGYECKQSAEQYYNQTYGGEK
jgi:hypothetical protein